MLVLPRTFFFDENGVAIWLLRLIPLVIKRLLTTDFALPVCLPISRKESPFRYNSANWDEMHGLSDSGSSMFTAGCKRSLNRWDWLPISPKAKLRFYSIRWWKCVLFYVLQSSIIWPDFQFFREHGFDLVFFVHFFCRLLGRRVATDNIGIHFVFANYF